MGKIVFIILTTLLFISCGKSTGPEHSNNKVKNGVYTCSFDTIKVADSTYIVNAIYCYTFSGSISAVKICVINEK